MVDINKWLCIVHIYNSSTTVSLHRSVHEKDFNGVGPPRSFVDSDTWKKSFKQRTRSVGLKAALARTSIAFSDSAVEGIHVIWREEEERGSTEKYHNVANHGGWGWVAGCIRDAAGGFSTAPCALQLAPSNSATCYPAMRSATSSCYPHSHVGSHSQTPERKWSELPGNWHPYVPRAVRAAGRAMHAEWHIPSMKHIIPNVYWTVHHCNSWRMKDQLDDTCYFISLIMCSTCFGH